MLISTRTKNFWIREAKKKKLNVTCSVAIHNLYFTDAVLTDFNTNYKVLPPLRTIGLESAFGVLQNIFTTKKTIDLLTKGTA